MYLFLEKGIRGGISYIAKLFSKGNSKNTYNLLMIKLSKYMTYLDSNNLYGWAMIQYLSYSGF